MLPASRVLFPERGDCAAVERLGNPVRLARHALEPRAVADQEAAAAAAHQPRALEEVQPVSNACPTDAEQLGDVLVRQADLVAVQTVVRHQKPARKAAINRVAQVRHRGALHLDYDRLDVAQENCSRLRPFAVQGDKRLGLDPKRAAAADVHRHFVRGAPQPRTRGQHAMPS